ncbi:MAG: glycine cleavage system protein GcvH [Candidatus Sericytochromatia bacterium]
MTIPATARFSETHEVIVPDGDRATVGISQHAVEQLGDVVFVEVPAVGTQLKKGQSFGVVESVKAVSDLYAPVDGEVLEVNPALVEEPGLVGEGVTGQGWLLRMRVADATQLDSLMAPDAYETFAASH